jgi:hypothetical protein
MSKVRLYDEKLAFVSKYHHGSRLDMMNWREKKRTFIRILAMINPRYPHNIRQDHEPAESENARQPNFRSLRQL